MFNNDLMGELDNEDNLGVWLVPDDVEDDEDYHLDFEDDDGAMVGRYQRRPRTRNNRERRGRS